MQQAGRRSKGDEGQGIKARDSYDIGYPFMEHGRWLCLCLRETPARAHTTGMRHTCDTGLVCRWVWCGPRGSRTPVFRNRRVVVGGSSLIVVGAPRARLASVPWTDAIRCRPGSVLSIPGARCAVALAGSCTFIIYPYHPTQPPHPLGCLPLYLSLFNTVISNKNNGKSGYNILISHHIRPRIFPSERMDAGQEKFAGHQAS